MMIENYDLEKECKNMETEKKEKSNVENQQLSFFSVLPPYRVVVSGRQWGRTKALLSLYKNSMRLLKKYDEYTK